MVKQAFDHDDEIMYQYDSSKWWDVYNVAAMELNEMPITDTSADPGQDAWIVLYGAGGDCLYDKPNKTFNIDGIVYDVRPDRTNIMSYFKHCFPSEAHFSLIQKTRSELAVTELHRKPVTDSIDVKTWRNKTEVGIEDATYPYFDSHFHPIILDNIPLKWASSKISVDDSEGPVSRAVIGLRILQYAGEGGLNIQLVDPNGDVHTLQQPSQNETRILDTISSLFYIDTTVKNGLWTLRVAEQPNYGFASHPEGYLYDWQLQFEAP